jgi:hypothetical protein
MMIQMRRVVHNYLPTDLCESCWKKVYTGSFGSVLAFLWKVAFTLKLKPRRKYLVKRLFYLLRNGTPSILNYIRCFVFSKYIIFTTYLDIVSIKCIAKLMYLEN